MKKNIYFYTNLFAWALVFLLASNYAFGWVTPSANPPSSNLPAPINVSSTAQSKEGYLAIGTSTAPTIPLTVIGNGYFSGSVGIGTSDPQAKLDIGAPVQGALRIGTGSDSGRIWTEYKNAGPALILYDYDDIGGGIYFRESPTTNDENNPEYEAFIVGKRGNIGIGTTVPGAKLDVAGHVRITGNDYQLWFPTNDVREFIRFGSWDRYAIGVQSSTQYFRTGKNFAWYKGGIHDDAELNPGGGTVQMVIKDGNVGIGTTSPGAKLDVVGTTLTNRESVAYYRNVIHKYGGSSQTGTLKITLPKDWSNTMMKVKIEGYNYNGGARGTSWSVAVGGYNYAPNTAWYNYFVEINGAAPFNTVRLAHDGTKNVILLGTTESSWSYPSIAVTEFMAGYSNITGWDSGWSISWITDETGIQNIYTPTIDVFKNTAGNVGIGTTSPGSKLQVNGEFQIESTAPQILFDDTDNTGTHYWIHNNSNRLYFLYDADGNQTWDSPHPLYFDGRNSILGGSLNMSSNKITSLATPTADTDAATKAYVDSNSFSCRTVTNSCSGTSSCIAVCASDERALGGLCAQGGQTNSYLTQVGNCSSYKWCCYWNSSQTYTRYAYANCCK